MKKITLISAIIGLSNGFSQELIPTFDDTLSNRDRIEISSFNYYSSNFATNEFTDKFIFGGTITSEIKDRVSSKLNRNNSIGGEFEQKLEFYGANVLPFKNDKYGLIISLSDNHLISGNISNDLFTTAFYGNSNSQNDTMDFGFSHLLYQHYLKLGFGIYNKSTLSSIRLSYVSGSRGIEGRLNNSWMHSQMDTVKLMLQGSGYATDFENPYWGFQGSGFAVDLNYNFFFDSRKGYNQMLNLKISNIGLMFWNNKTQNYDVDSMTTYTGFNVQNFINRGDSEDPTYNFQDTLGIQTRTGSRMTSLPIEFAIQKVPLRHSIQKLQYLAGFKTILTADYFPYLYGGLYYMPNHNFAASTRLSYGGFGGFQWGLNLNLWLNDKAYFALGTFDVIGLVSKKFGFGRSLNFVAHFNL